MFEVPASASLVLDGLILSGSGDSAIRNYGRLSVGSTTFVGNESDRDGGAIDNHAGIVVVDGSTFTGNTSASGFAGGAIATHGGTLRITSSTFADNDSGDDGGAIDNEDGSLVVTSSTFVGNSSPVSGGAVASTGATAVRNSLFYGNAALVGDAIASVDGVANLEHSIVAGGGGCAGVAGGDNLSDVDGSRCGDVAVDEGLDRVEALDDNGGATPTIALLSGNPAIDGGHNGYCSEAGDTGRDQRGFPRPHSRSNPCDIGAYEANRISVPDVLLKEGSGRCTRVEFTVELDAPTLEEVGFTPRVNGGHACDPNGVAARRLNRVTFVPGDDSATVATGVLADEEFGSSRRISLEIVDEVNAVIGRGGRRATATIVNDDRNQDPVAADHSATDEDDPGCGWKTCQPARSAGGTVAIAIGPSSAPISSASPESDAPFASPAQPVPAPSPASPLPVGDGASPAGGLGTPSSTPEGAGPDLALRDTILELVGEGSASGSAGDMLYALGTDPALLSAAGDSLRLRTTVLNQGDGDSPPTSISVASADWTGESVAVPSVAGGSEVGIDESMPAPPGVTGDTEFVVTIGMVEGELDPTNNAEPDLVAAIVGPDNSSSFPVAVALLAAAVLAAAAAIVTTSLLRRRPSFRSAHASENAQQAGGARPGGLTDLADRYLGADPGARLTLAGPACRRLREALGDEERAGPLIATLYWRALIETPGFRRSLAALGASAGAIDYPDMLVVSHAGGTRHDLVVLDPDYAPPEPSSAVVDVSLEELTGVWETLSCGVQEGLSEACGSAPTSTVMEVVAEAARFERFGLVVAPKPEVVLTRCPSPAWPVGEGEEIATSSAGAVVVDASGRKGVTVADHAVRGHEKVMINGCIGTVVSSDAISDSSFVEVDVVSTGVFRGEKGPLSGVSPRQMEVVEFDGVRSGHTTTRVVGWDPTILTMDSYIQNKIVTEPITVQGDSGAALVDGEGHVLGFAFYTTGLNAHPAHSGWIWADSVYRAHGLTPWKEG